MKVEKKSLKEMFPNLFKELKGNTCKVAINSARKSSSEAEKSHSAKFNNYTPTVLDFIRRCDTEVQAEAIIAYLEKKGELTKEYADEIRIKLKREGIRSFGSKKEDDYYFKHGGLC